MGAPAPSRSRARSVGPQSDARPHLAQFRRLLEHLHGDAPVIQGQRGGQAADAPADDEHGLPGGRHRRNLPIAHAVDGFEDARLPVNRPETATAACLRDPADDVSRLTWRVPLETVEQVVPPGTGVCILAGCSRQDVGQFGEELVNGQVFRGRSALAGIT